MNYSNQDELGYSACLDEVRKKNYTLVPSQYIKFHDLDDNRNIKNDIIDYSNRLHNIMLDSFENTKEVIQLLEELKNED